MSYKNTKYSGMKLVISFVMILFVGVFSGIAQTHMTKIKDGTISGTVATPSLGAILELESVNKGFLTPRLTTQQRDAIDPLHRTDGLMIYNRTTGCFNYWSTGQDTWLSICGTPPPAVFDISALQCDALAINGTFRQGAFLTGANYLIIPVTVTQAGTYEILATTTNGYYFTTKGAFPSAGNFTLILEGVGTPNIGYNAGELGDKLTITLNNKPSTCIDKYVFVTKAAVDFQLNCSTVHVDGNYFVGKDLASDNKIRVEVNVNAVGYWSISTNIVNGYAFSGSGTFTATGIQEVELVGTGRPVTSGTNLFNLSSNSDSPNTCSVIPVTVKTIEYTVDCDNAILAGNYQQDEAVTAGHTVTLRVDVVATGDTTIQTNTVGGIYFTSGPLSFDTIGRRDVVLTAVGTPTTPGTNTFTLNPTPGLVRPCSFDVNVINKPVAYNLICNSIATSGKYAPNIPMTAENKILLNVNVQYAGNYTVTTNTVNGITFSGNGTFANTGLQEVVLTATGTPTSGGIHSFTISTNSTSGANTCNVSIEFVYRRMNVLGLGSGRYQPGSASNTETSRVVLQAAANFGPNGTVKTDGFTIVNGATNQGNALKNLINSNNIDIIVIGYNYLPSAATIPILNDFVHNKKGVLIHSQENGASGVASLLNTLFGGGGFAVSGTRSTYINSISTVDDPILNGPFGDLRGKAAGSDVNNSYYVTGNSNQLISLVQHNADQSRIWMLKHKTLGYVYVGDGGWSSGYANNNSTTIWPAAMSAGGLPVAKAYYDGTTVYNSLLYANTMTWAIQYAQKNVNVNYTLR